MSDSIEVKIVVSRAKFVLECAENEAKKHGHDEVSNLHVLLPLIVQRDAYVLRCLEYLNVSCARIVEEIEKSFSSYARKSSRGTNKKAKVSTDVNNVSSEAKKITYSEEVRQLNDLAAKAAKKLGARAIQTRDIFLGLCASESSTGRLLNTLWNKKSSFYSAAFAYFRDKDFHDFDVGEHVRLVLTKVGLSKQEIVNLSRKLQNNPLLVTVLAGLIFLLKSSENEGEFFDPVEIDTIISDACRAQLRTDQLLSLQSIEQFDNNASVRDEILRYFES